MGSLAQFWRNLLALPQATTASTIFSGFVIVIVGYTGPLLVIIEAAQRGGLTNAETASWVWGAIVGNGILCILLSLWYGIPITAPYSTAGAALLGLSLVNFTLPEAVGAYIVTGVLLFVLGLSGLFARVVQLIPQPIALGVVAGVLLRFGLSVFTALPESPLVVTAMLVTFFVLRRVGFRVPMLGALIVGSVLAMLAGDLQFQGVTIELTQPIFVMPVFTLEAIVTLSLPLFALALSSQYIPGVAVLQLYGYKAPINAVLMVTGAVSALLAFVASHGVSLGALTAAFVASPDAHPDPDKRYAAAVYSGVWHTSTGLFGATVVSFFAVFPQTLIATIAGLALISTIVSSLTNALQDPNGRDAAVMAFLCTAANFSLLGIGAPFWGLLVGVIVYNMLNWGKVNANKA